MPQHVSLTADWTVRAAGTAADVPAAVGDRVVPATVPGCVHTDLLAAGLIEDPYLDDAESRLHWIGRSDWEYRTVFDAEVAAFERVDLVCHGLDTVAEVALNGHQVAETQNMHRTYRFDVTEAMRPAGSNELAVTFRSAYAYTSEVERTLGPRPNAYPEPFNLIRKMASNFGWDWGPTLVTAGIWRPIGLHAWSTARLARVRPVVEVVGRDGLVTVHVDVERTAGGRDRELEVRVVVAGVTASGVLPGGSESVTVAVDVPDVRLWWPRGMGEQPLHHCVVTLTDGLDPELDRWQERIGFRTFELDTDGDEARSAFTFVVNGVPIFAKGVNWIPDDCFPTRVDRERCRERLQQAVDLGVNVVRVWGGGLYESDDFYELCDELGLLVWQDFLFACAAYPEEEPLASEVEAEARDNVARLMPHPSLVLWCGNNENIWMYDTWGWEKPLAGRSWGEGYYYRLLPQVMAEVDPSRTYWAGSPWSGDPDRDPNDPDHGCIHIWNVWNGTDYLAYRDLVPSFVSEFGWQAPPTYATLRRAVHDDPLGPSSPMMLHHQKAVDGQLNLERGIESHFRPPHSFDDWHFLTQVNQARAMQVGIEHWLASWPRTAGAIIWQLNDCWPVSSWALVDGDGRRKPSWYAVRRTFDDRLVTVQPDGEDPVAVLVNLTDEPWVPVLRRRLVDAQDGALVDLDSEVVVPPRSTTRVALEASLRPADPRGQILVVEADGSRSCWFFVEDKDFRHPATAPVVDVARDAEGYVVTIHAQGLMRDVLLQPDRLAGDAVADDALLTVLPGETVRLRVRTSADLDPDDLARHPVLNWVGAAHGRSADGGSDDRLADDRVAVPATPR